MKTVETTKTEKTDNGADVVNDKNEMDHRPNAVLSSSTDMYTSTGD